MKSTYRALLQLLLTAFIWSLTHRFMPDNWLIVKELIWVILLVGMGYAFAPSSKKNNRWVGKTVLSILLLMILGIRFLTSVFLSLRLFILLGIGRFFLRFIFDFYWLGLFSSIKGLFILEITCDVVK